MSKPHALIVDDSLEMAQTVADYLEAHDFTAEATGGAAEALERFAARPADVVLTDLRMKDGDGLSVVEGIHRTDPAVPVVIMTAFGGIDSAVEAIRRGAYHYVTKPFKMDVVRTLLARAAGERTLRAENEQLRKAVRERFSIANLVGRSEPLRRMTDLLLRLAAADSPVLIQGETGTGKELVARAIHLEGRRATGAFVAVNCAALPESLLESELFGHAKGSFTGATQARRGLFLEADGGTLFLDEIGDMPLPLQSKLLRVIESGEVRAVGSDTVRRADVRIIAATHRDLPALVTEHRFREDLFFRLNVVPLRVPPLRERREDIPLLASHFLAQGRARFPASRVERLSAGAMAALGQYPFPGNVRELENLIERFLVIGAGPEITERDVREALGPDPARDPLAGAMRDLVPLQVIEQRYIAWVLEQVGGNKTRAADILGIDPSTLYRREKQGKA